MTQLCLTLDALLESESSRDEVMECYFLEALYCSLGATLLESGRIKFDEFIKNLSCLTTVHDEKTLAGPGEIPGKKGSVFSLVYYNVNLHYKNYNPLCLVHMCVRCLDQVNNYYG